MGIVSLFLDIDFKLICFYRLGMVIFLLEQPMAKYFAYSTL